MNLRMLMAATALITLLTIDSPVFGQAERAASGDEVASELERELQAALTKLHAMQEHFGSDHANVRQVKEMIAALRQQIQRQQSMVKAYDLRFVSSQDAATMMDSMFNDHQHVRIAADERQNRLIVHADDFLAREGGVSRRADQC